MPSFARGMVFDVNVLEPPQVGGLLNLLSYELFRFADLLPGRLGTRQLCIGASDAYDIVINDPCVSSMHALVVCRGAGSFRLLDTRSHNGVHRVVRQHSEKLPYLDLAVGHRIVLGATTLLCVTEDGHAPLTAFDVSEFLFTPDDRDEPRGRLPGRQDTSVRFIGMNEDSYQTRLAALDEIAAAARAALYRAPQDPMLNQYYLTTLGAREATLRQIGATLPAQRGLESY